MPCCKLRSSVPFHEVSALRKLLAKHAVRAVRGIATEIPRALQPRTQQERLISPEQR
eukprot:SAG31_NODE_18782_length_623_cov_0.690840_1_plen_56_part_10